MKRPLIVCVLCVSAAALAACGGGGIKVKPGGPGAGPAAKLEDSFGAGFAAAFQQGPNTDPREPAAGDVIAVSATTDPVPVP